MRTTCNSPKSLGSNEQNFNLNNQAWPRNVTLFQTRPPVTINIDSEELSAIGFAEQAQARNLPADINRFETLPPQKEYVQINNQRMPSHANNLQNLQTEIKSELIRMNQSLINLEVRIENLTLRLSHEIRSASISPAPSKAVNSNIYQSINKDTQNALIYPSGSDGALSLEDKLKKRVLEDLLQQSQQSRVITPNSPESGEITVKKTIVERLLEELNETKTSTDENTPSNVENTGDFISLSDYINKIMRDEAQ